MSAGIFRHVHYQQYRRSKRRLLNTTAAPQRVYAVSDTSVGAWTTESGSTSGLYQSIDENPPSDANYIKSEVAPNASAVEIKFGTLADPVTSVGHRVHYRIGKLNPLGKQIDMVVRLKQGTSVIATYTHSNVGALETIVQTLSASEADSITDYSDLRLNFEATQVL